jgi:regulator of RNase E activity RraA
MIIKWKRYRTKIKRVDAGQVPDMGNMGIVVDGQGVQPGQWAVRDDDGKTIVMTDQEFKALYELARKPKKDTTTE